MMQDLSTLCVGDEVAELSVYGYRACRILKVTKVLKQYFETDEGTKWGFNGYIRGGVGYRRRSVERATDKHRGDIQIDHLRATVESWVREHARTASLHTLGRVHAAIMEAKDGEEKAS